ncbi:hypothetical protein KM043_014930 [Ampulex compressa]|nr:hypothetical protein KM043_014930 [Ampulex compressa]
MEDEEDGEAERRKPVVDDGELGGQVEGNGRNEGCRAEMDGVVQSKSYKRTPFRCLEEARSCRRARRTDGGRSRGGSRRKRANPEEEWTWSRRTGDFVA